MMIYLLFLIYPFHSNWINTDNQGLIFSSAPFVPPKHTIYFNINGMLGVGMKPNQADTGDIHYYVDGIEGVGFTPLSQLELFVGSQTFVKYVWTIPYPLYRVDYRHIAPYPQVVGAAKIVFPSPDKKLSFGALMHGAYWINGGDGGLENNIVATDFQPTEKTKYEGGIRGLFGACFPIGATYVTASYMFAMVDRLDEADSTFGWVGITIGEELTLWPYVHPAIEYIQQDTFCAIIPQIKFPLGFFTIMTGLSFPYSKQFDWVPNDSLDRKPALVISLNGGYTFPIKPPPPKNIVIKGKVIDSILIEPAEVDVAFIGPECGKMKTKKDGTYIIKLGHEGAYRLGIDAPDYIWQERIFELMDYDTVIADFVLKRNLDWSMEGRVLSRKTKKGIGATVRLSGKKGRETLTDPETGVFRIWVNSGKYTLTVSADGYQTETFKYNIKNRKTIQKTIYLYPEGMPKKGKARARKKK